MPGLKTYLTQGKQESYNEPPTGAALLKSEYELQQKVGHGAPTKEYRQLARLRLASAKPERVFKIVGLDKPKVTKAQ